MPIIARLIGGAGTGKTTELLRIMEKTIEQGVRDPTQIGFVSFTRAARSEAANRAADKFDFRQADLEEHGWFRTLHSVCYKLLAPGGRLLAPNKETRTWLENALQAEVDACGGDDADMADVAFSGDTEAMQALNLWSAARSRLEPFAAVWHEASQVSDRLPDLEQCEQTIERYEQAKRLDDRIDFTDLLGKYSGWSFSLNGAYQVDPEGEIPGLPVWFFDEQQDTSPLLDAVCRRLISTPTCKWVYITGDPFQSIYGWAGASSKCFMAWDVAKDRIMPKSYRCGPDVHHLGEDVLRECSDYFDRGIAPADHDCSVESQWLNSNLASEVDPRESWLLLARTNHLAKKLATLLDRENIPWLPTRGGGRWQAPVRHEALTALWDIEHGEPISGKQWRRVVKVVPSKQDGRELLQRGTKVRFASDAEATRFPVLTLPDLDCVGATTEFAEFIVDGRWRSVVDGADRFCESMETYGEQATLNPGIKIGTIHSAKGAEADNVAMLTTTTGVVERGQQTDRGFDEEARVRYVGVTRARKRLIILKERGKSMRMKLP